MPGLLRGIARTAVIAGTATAVSNRVSRRQAGRWAQQERAYPEQEEAASQPGGPPGQATGSPDALDARIAQLRQLAELKAQGVLTDAEFEAQKSQLLGT
jgi:hypothetical protein